MQMECYCFETKKLIKITNKEDLPLDFYIIGMGAWGKGYFGADVRLFSREKKFFLSPTSPAFIKQCVRNICRSGGGSPGSRRCPAGQMLRTMPEEKRSTRRCSRNYRRRAWKNSRAKSIPSLRRGRGSEQIPSPAMRSGIREAWSEIPYSTLE